MASRSATWIAFGAICKRNLTTLTTQRSSPRQHLLSHVPPPPHHGRLASKAAQGRKLPKNHFTSNRALRQDATDQQPKKDSKRKSARSKAASTSLRRVAVEAQRSRIVQGKGRKRHVDPGAEAKEVTAYCAAETYRMGTVRHLLVQEGYQTDPLKTDLYPQVVHVQTPNFVTKNESTGESREAGVGDVFVFPSGSVVTWNVPERVANNLVTRILSAAAENPHTTEIEDFDYLEDNTRDSSIVLGDTIILGTKPSDHSLEQQPPAADTNTSSHPPPETSTTLAKIAFSSALARSTKLAVLENSLSHYFLTTRQIPSTLSSSSPLLFTRKFILRKTGELLSIRAQLNLYSELTDSLPDLFWDSPHELGLESYYDNLGKALDVGVRIKVLNEKIDYASEIAAVLREKLSEKHSSQLEWLIIALITIEVGFGIWEIRHILLEEKEEEKTRKLLNRYLEAQLARSDT